jgi:hypothetical protein
MIIDLKLPSSANPNGLTSSNVLVSNATVATKPATTMLLSAMPTTEATPPSSTSWNPLID